MNWKSVEVEKWKCGKVAASVTRDLLLSLYLLVLGNKTITEAPISRSNVGTMWSETCFTRPRQNTDTTMVDIQIIPDAFLPHDRNHLVVLEILLFLLFWWGCLFFPSTFSCCVLWCSWCSIAVKSSGTSSDIHYSWCYINANHCWLSFPFILDSLAL